MKKISQKEFKSEVTDTTGVVVVDVFADWCGPCKLLKPTLEKLAASGIAKFVIVDADSEPELVSQHNVSALPTLLFFKDGILNQKVTGLQSEASIKKTIEDMCK